MTEAAPRNRAGKKGMVERAVEQSLKERRWVGSSAKNGAKGRGARRLVLDSGLPTTSVKGVRRQPRQTSQDSNEDGRREGETTLYRWVPRMLLHQMRCIINGIPLSGWHRAENDAMVNRQLSIITTFTMVHGKDPG